MANDPVTEMLVHYEAVDESTRLTRSPHGRLEFLRTQMLLRRFLPDPPARILDVGGATGVHATWLAADGYEVVLIDPVPHHVDTAAAFGTFRCRVGDARDLSEPDDSVDAVLLLGPLYHLTGAKDRLTALGEARRVLRPGGLVAAAAISRYLAALEVGSSSVLDQERVRLAGKLIETGEYAGFLGFTAGHWHRPDELRDEVQAMGFTDIRVLGIEGPT